MGFRKLEFLTEQHLQSEVHLPSPHEQHLQGSMVVDEG
jgi:hypothetical protein